MCVPFQGYLENLGFVQHTQETYPQTVNCLNKEILSCLVSGVQWACLGRRGILKSEYPTHPRSQHTSKKPTTNLQANTSSEKAHVRPKDPPISILVVFLLNLYSPILFLGGCGWHPPPPTPQGVNGEACALGIASMTRLFRSAKLLKSLVFPGHQNGGNFGMKRWKPHGRRHESMGIDPVTWGSSMGGYCGFFVAYKWHMNGWVCIRFLW